MKKCINCGRELPEEAVFCPYCETNQSERPLVKVPKKNKWLPWLILAAAAVFVIFLFMALRHRPKTYEGGASVVYKSGSTEWNVFATFNRKKGIMGEVQESYSDSLAAGQNGGVPALINAMTEGEAGNEELLMESSEEFYNLIDEITLTAQTEDYERYLYIMAPVRDTAIFPTQVVVSSINYYATTGKQDLDWNIRMKNGDEIILHQTMDINMIETVEITWENYPMNSSEELSVLLEQLTDKYPAEHVKITLPPVTYTDALTLGGRGFELIGTTDGEKTTTFKDTINIITRNVCITEFYNIRFEGSGGTGLLLNEAAQMDSCIFTGWDEAVSAQDGSWPIINNCVFENNKTGLLFDSKRASCSCLEYRGNTFENNSTAVKLVNIPGIGELYFNNMVFKDNDIDVDNTSSFEVVYLEPEEVN